MTVIVCQFTTLDGIVTDPDGSDGTDGTHGRGGWAFRFGPEAVAGDKFRLGPIFDEGVMLLGRTTWELFARLWPNRDDEFSQRMNAMPKLVASHSRSDVSAWANSRLVDGDLLDAVKQEERDVVVIGSASVVDQLMAADLVDEFRLMTFPIVLGSGRGLFPADGPELELACVSADQVGAAVLTRWRTRRPVG
ncbi:dihydrofolate reductase family protein [Labedaea rhizosphaerae]|uniref:RibD domain-containing protein n=1 Tax=Labedaea rhizosphaerae TaxID=598644 RepID=A0A4R6RYW9_LABRH|nr:dihydrofolate reductase family protein [Labedaea rhizosphaerae]TDP92153.1 RibD domain-containing protein [Labedaea rhizosphaerae]